MAGELQYRVVCGNGTTSKAHTDRAFVESCRDQAQGECRFNPHHVEVLLDDTWVRVDGEGK